MPSAIWRGLPRATATTSLLISKAAVNVAADEPVDAAVAKRAAHTWTMFMEQSLKELDTDHVDAYYQMAANNPGVVRAEEMQRAFEDAKAAGKVSYLGISTHEKRPASA